MAVITFGLGLFADFTLSPQAFLLKNQLAVTTAPLEILISILYWGLSAVCRAPSEPAASRCHRRCTESIPSLSGVQCG